MEKYLVWPSKALSKIGLDPRNHIHSTNSMVITEISIFTVSKAKRGACPNPFGGGVQKSLVQYSKALSIISLKGVFNYDLWPQISKLDIQMALTH